MRMARDVSSLRKGAKFIRYKGSLLETALYQINNIWDILSASDHRLVSYFTEFIRFTSSHVKFNISNLKVSASF